MKVALHFPDGTVINRECPSFVALNQRVEFGGKAYYAADVWWDADSRLEMTYHARLKARGA